MGLTHLGAQMLAGQTQACGQVQRACAHPESCCPIRDQVQVLLLWAGWKEESEGLSTHVRLNASTRQVTHGIFNIPRKKSSGGGGQCEGRWGVLTLPSRETVPEGRGSEGHSHWSPQTLKEPEYSRVAGSQKGEPSAPFQSSDFKDISLGKRKQSSDRLEYPCLYLVWFGGHTG